MAALKQLCRSFAFLVVVFLSQRAHAEEPRWMLKYEAPDGVCPTEAQVRGLVVARLGFDPFAAAPSTEPGLPQPTLRITMTEADAKLRARVERVDAGNVTGERELAEHAAHCAELAASAAFAASLLIDPTGSMRQRFEARTEPAPTGEPASVENPFRAEPVPLPPPPKAAPPSTLAWTLGLRAHGSVGLAPSLSFGLSLALAVRTDAFALGVEGRTDLPAGVDLPGGARTSSTLGSVVPCYLWKSLGICGVLSLGVMQAETTIAPIERDTDFFAAAGVRGVGEAKIAGPLSAQFLLEGLAPLRRLTVRYRGAEVWTAAAVALSLGAGALLRF